MSTVYMGGSQSHLIVGHLHAKIAFLLIFNEGLQFLHCRHQAAAVVLLRRSYAEPYSRLHSLHYIDIKVQGCFACCLHAGP